MPGHQIQYPERIVRAFVGLVGLVVAAALLAGCGGDPAGDPGGLAHPDDVLPVVEYGFTPLGAAEPATGGVTYGFVVANTSTQVVRGVRVHVAFFDADGEEIAGLAADHDLSAVLPGQPMGSGATVTGVAGMADRPPVDMGVAVTLVGALDDPTGGRHRDPPGPYAVLELGEPAAGASQDARRIGVTNTYDMALTPVVHDVLRSPDGMIVGGIAAQAMAAPIPPGGTATALVTPGTEIGRQALGDTVHEVYVDPGLAAPAVAVPAWEDG